MLRTLAAGAVLTVATCSLATAQTAMSARSVLVSVSDASGQPIIGLLPEDFLLDANGMAIEALEATPARYPLVILVDTGTAAREFVTTFRAPLRKLVERTALSPIAVVTFGDTPVFAVKFTPDAQRASKGLNGLFARPETPSYLMDGLHRVAEEVKRMEVPVVDAIVVTAPSFDASRRDTDRLVRDLLASHVRVHVVAHRTRVSGNSATPAPKAGRSVTSADMMVYTAREQVAVLTDIARSTGGSLQQVDLQGGLDDALQQIHARHLGEYIVDYIMPATDKPESLRLKVRLPGTRVTMMSLTPAMDESKKE